MTTSHASDPVRILLIDDDEDDYFITNDLLADIERQQFKLDWASTYNDGFAAFFNQAHDIYLVDYRLGSENGLTLLRAMIDHGTNAPIILLTGQGDHEVDIEAMQAGAADYLVKGQINPQLLERSIRYAIERRRAEDARIKLENQLRQAQKMDAIGQLAGGIAHDFNNVLTAIMSYAGVAKRMLDPDHRAVSRIDGIEESVQRAASLTRQLLAFASRQFIAPQVLDLNQLVLNVSHLLRRLISANIELVTLPADGLGLTKADPGQLEQVIINLVVNARDAMPNGGKLLIETSNVTLDETYTQQHLDMWPGEYVLLAVTDTGSGMPPEVLAHIFEPFFTTKEEGKGTGLGLATCYGIIKQSEGYIHVYSEEGTGTTFKVYLPRVHDTAVTTTAVAKSEHLPTGTETVLLAEDEPSVRQLVTTVLHQQGYTVIAAANGVEALHLARENTELGIDLLVSDVVMPQMGGSLLAQSIKTIYPDIKILFISGYPDNSVTQSGILEQGSAFLQKPFSSELLAHKVRDLLDEE